MDRRARGGRLVHRTPEGGVIGRALRAQARSFAGDIVLLGVTVAALLMSLSLAMSIPPDLAGAPLEAREALAGSLTAVIAMYGAVLAAVYGSFRYTVDRRDGVIAQRLMLQSRWVTLLVRVPGAVVGGAVVSLAGLVGGHLALTVTAGGIPVEWSTVGSTLALGAVAGLWGMGLGVVVQVHLVALFLVSLSMSGPVLLAMLWGAGAVYLPPLVMLEAFRLDIGALGVAATDRLDGSLAAGVTAGWMVAALLAGALAFLRRDVT